MLAMSTARTPVRKIPSNVLAPSMETAKIAKGSGTDFLEIQLYSAQMLASPL
jgi:hypothetical protein